jgi:YesN/AraC family two-component response regulator
MKIDKPFSFDIGNLKILITLCGGFFNLTNPDDIIHAHANYELHFVIKGTCFIRTDAKTYILCENDVCLIPPGIIHSCIAGSEDSVKSSLSFSLKKTNRVCAEDFFTVFTDLFAPLSEPLIFKERTQSIYYLRRIISDIYIDNIFSNQKSESLLSIIFIDLAQEASEAKNYNMKACNNINSKIDNDIRPALIEDYMNFNYMKKITLEDLSRVLHTGQKQTNRIIKKHFNMSFIEYLIRLRINAAKRLLSTTDLMSKDIAQAVGYEAYNGFYYMFKSKTGMTPEMYREKKKSELS